MTASPRQPIGHYRPGKGRLDLYTPAVFCRFKTSEHHLQAVIRVSSCIIRIGPFRTGAQSKVLGFKGALPMKVAARLLCLALASLLVTACAETVVESPATESPAIGYQIAFTGDYDIYVMDADGGNVQQLTEDRSKRGAQGESGRDSTPAWLPVP